MRQRLQSLRFRMPMSLVLVALLTFLFLSLVVGLQTSINLERDLERSLQAQAHALAPILTDALLHDDVWTAYTALHGPRQEREQKEGGSFRLVLDEQGKVFVSDRPRQFPLATTLDGRFDENLPLHSQPPTAPGVLHFDGCLA